MSVCFTSKSHGVFVERRGDQFHRRGVEHANCGYASPEDGGQGVYLRWWAEGNSIVAENDRYGIHPGFYFADGGRFGIATSVAELQTMSAASTLDDAAMAVFLRLGYYLGNDTPFQQIRAVPPGCRLVWSGNKVQLSNVRPCDPPKLLDISRQEASSKYGRLFQESVESLHRNGTSGVPLSGGQDSRHILLALMEAGKTPDFTVTLESPCPRPGTDAQIASELARRLSLPHTVVAQTPDRLGRELRKNELTGFCADEHAWFLPMLQFYAEHGIQHSWDGIAGDILSSGIYLEGKPLALFRSCRLEELADFFLMEEGYLQKSLGSELYDRWNRNLARRRLVTELERHVSAPNPVASFLFWNRVRRELALAPWGLLAQQSTVLAPFLNDRVFDFLMSLPAEIMIDQKFHMDTMRHMYPWMPDVPFDSDPKGATLEKSATTRRFCRELATYAVVPARRQKLVNRSFLLPPFNERICRSNFWHKSAGCPFPNHCAAATRKSPRQRHVCNMLTVG